MALVLQPVSASMPDLPANADKQFMTYHNTDTIQYRTNPVFYFFKKCMFGVFFQGGGFRVQGMILSSNFFCMAFLKK